MTTAALRPSVSFTTQARQPRTGSEVTGLLQLAGALVLLGLALVCSTRRREDPTCS